MAALRRWHDLRWWLPVNQLVDRIVRELRLVELTAELRRPRDHWRRLRFLVDQARAFCDAGGSGLSDFVAWAVDQIESEADVLETVVPEPDDDAVRILTVHGSKGLEFPVTIVAGLGVAPRSGADVLWGGPRPEVRLKADVLETAVLRPASGREGVGPGRGRPTALRRDDQSQGLPAARLLPQAVGGYGSHAQQLWRLLETRHLRLSNWIRRRWQPVESTSLEVSVAGNRHAVLSEGGELLAAVTSRVATSDTGVVARRFLHRLPSPSSDRRRRRRDNELP